MPYTFTNSSGTNNSVTSSALGGGTITLTRYDESGVATANTFNVASYNVNSAIIANGTGANDSVTGTTGNDLFVWDDNTLPSGSRGTASGTSRYGWTTTNATTHIEDWYGGAGNDVFNFTTVSGGTALPFATTIFGGTGSDVVWESNQNDTVFGDDGLDTIYGAGGNDVLAGDSSLSTTTSAAGDGADILYGGSGVDTIYASGGNDTAYGGTGVDTIYGGDGNDILMGDDSASTTTSGTSDGADVLFGGAGNDTIYAAGGNDTIFAGAGTDIVYGGDGDDTLDGGAGADALDGGAGINYASYASASAGVTLDLTTPANSTGDAVGDTYTNIAGYIGSTFNDTMFGSGGGDLEYGGLGDDHLEGGAGGADTLYGGDGNDFLSGMYSDSGGGMPDTLYGDNGDDTLLFSNEGTAVPVTGTYYGWTGEAGASSIITLTLNGQQDTADHLYGGSGFDTVDASLVAASTQEMFIRAGKDANLDWIMSAEYFIASNNADIVNLSYSAGTTVGQVAITDDVTVTGLEGNDTIISGAGDDVLVGGSMTAAATTLGSADTIWGGSGDDKIWGDDYGDTITATGGEGGNDTLYGADGADSIMSQGGSDLAYGGAGNDVIWSDQGNWGLGTSSVMGNDTIYGGDGDDFVIDLGGRNSVGITTSNDVAYGGLGNDVISVFAGNDTIDAGAGNDVIWGGPGNDIITAGDGNDFIYGGSGTGDTLIGGNGADWYYFSRDDGTETVNEVSAEGAVNHLVIFGSFSTSADGTQPASEFVAGSGVHETDSGEALTVGHVLGNHTDTAAQTGNVNVTYNSATSITVSVAGTSSAITFNPLLFADITLFNHDATNGHQMQELYTWDPNARGAGQGGFEFSAYIG